MLQGNINAVYTIYTQVSRTMWAMMIRVLQNQPLRIKCPLKWCASRFCLISRKANIFSSLLLMAASNAIKAIGTMLRIQ